MFAAARALVAPSITFASNPRSARLAHEHSKLSRSAIHYVATRPGVFPLGPDPLLQQLISSKGFAKFDIVHLRISANARNFTAICVPTRVWRNLERRQELLRIKDDAALLGTKCIIVPQRWLRANIRGQVARILALSHRVRVSRRDAEIVKEHVETERFTTLADCSSKLMAHEDAIGVVLSLCASGDILIDRTRPIGPGSWISAGRHSVR